MTRRLVALLLLLCVGRASIEVLFGSESEAAAWTLASGAGAAPEPPFPADHHEDEGCPCLCACGCAGAMLTVAPVPVAFLAAETGQRVAEVETTLEPAHRTTAPRARPPLA